MAPPPLEEIIRKISELPLKEILAYLVYHGIRTFSKEGYYKIKKIIQDKQNEGKYAFVPDAAEARKLLNLSENPDYKEILLLVPKYQYIDLIRTGLLIDRYQKENTEKANSRIKVIKLQIVNRPNGEVLLKIANLPTTPFFSLIVNYLHELKKQGFLEVFLVEKFNEIVNTWENSSKFIRSEDRESDIISFCDSQIALGRKAFFILGMKSAGRTIETAIKSLSKIKYFEKKGYSYKINTSAGKGIPRKVEVTISRDIIS
jgi:hypothetical protein